MGGSGKPCVTTPPFTTPGHHNLLSMSNQIGHDPIRGYVLHHGPQRDENANVLSPFAVLISALTMGTSFGPKLFPMTKSQQSVDIFIGHQDDISTVTTIPPIRSTFGHIFLMPKTDATVSPPATPHRNLNMIDEHQAAFCSFSSWRRPTKVLRRAFSFSFRCNLPWWATEIRPVSSETTTTTASDSSLMPTAAW